MNFGKLWNVKFQVKYVTLLKFQFLQNELIQTPRKGFLFFRGFFKKNENPLKNGISKLALRVRGCGWERFSPYGDVHVTDINREKITLDG
jgi:hypothetical protein